MTSLIDTTKPVYGNPTTQSVRDNFLHAYDEITDLQAKTAQAPFLPINGGTMNGPITMQQDPLNPLEVATKKYVDDLAFGDSGGTPEAPTDGLFYARGNTTGGNTWSHDPLFSSVHIGPNPATDRFNIGSDTTYNFIQMTTGNNSLRFNRSTNIFEFVRNNASIQSWSDTNTTLTVPLVLPANPTGSLQAAPKQYVDTFMPKAGGVFTGAITLPGNPTNALDAVPKQYADLFMPKAGGTFSGNVAVTGSFSASDTVYSSAGRIISTGANNPSVSVWATNRNHAAGMFHGGGDDNLYFSAMDGSGNYSAPYYGYFAPNGDLYLRTHLSVANGMVTAGAVNVSGDMTANNLVTKTGIIYVGGPGQYYLARDGNNGNWNFVEGGTVNFTVQIDGSTNTRGTVQGGALYSRSRVYAGDVADFCLGPGGNGRIFQFGSNWYWDWNVGNGVLVWMRASSVNWVQHGNATCYNNESWVGGRGPYIDLSDENYKESIEPSSYGLNDIMKVEPIRFRRKPIHNDEIILPEIGFSAQQIQSVLPEAIRHMDVFDGDGNATETLGIATTPIVAALVKAVQELATRVVTLESK